ncbi:hypothetical protein JYU16_02365 [bacterium AH-315-M05]|nr:hypothetical protein [bacterium AH-315-M05]
MKKRFTRILCFLLFVSGAIHSCTIPKHKQAKSFTLWYEEHFSQKQQSHIDYPDEPPAYSLEIMSSSLQIDTLYSSMQGPIDIKRFAFDENEELIWLTGYSVVIVDEKSKLPLSDELMCHNNLNISNKATMPWKVKTLGSETRLFTLSEGQTKVVLPRGFAIPLPANHPLEVASQVLNHNILNPDLTVQHGITINYIKESEVNSHIKPLYQQTLFVTKLIAGPEGQYGEHPKNSKHTHVHSGKTFDSAGGKSCNIGEHEIDPDSYNPFRDEYGRKFTGHWQINHGKEVLRTNVTSMLNLTFDTKVHYIGVHVHPFAESLELRDITTDTTIFKANVENFSDKIGIKQIDHFSSAQGIPMYKNHEYELISIYRDTTNENHTAMATMFLSLHDKE